MRKQRWSTRTVICFCLTLFLNGTFVHAATPPSDSPDQTTAKSSSKRDLPIQDLFSSATARVEAQADSVEYDKNSKLLIAKNNVVLNYENMQMTADYAEVETESKKALGRGHVIIFENGKAFAQGQEINYDFKNHSGTFPDGRMINFPWFSRGEDIQQVKEGVKIITNGGITSCDLKDPHYEIKAKKVTVYDNDKMFARNVTFYILGKPVFWLPYLIVPLQNRTLPFTVTSGYNSRHGFFIGASKGFSIIKQVWGRVQADWRAKRGFGAGGDLGYKFTPFGYGLFNLYATEDHRSPNAGTDAPYSQLEDHKRGRIMWRHRTDFNDETYLMMRYNRISDEFFMQDFFEKESRAEVEPQSFISLTKNSAHYGLLAYAQKRMNKFERIVERLPMLQADWRAQPLLRPWLFYQSQISYNNMVKQFGRDDRNTDARRIDNFHEWSTPVQWRDFKFTPRANLRGTYYNHTRYSDGDQFRAYGEVGSDLRTQLYRAYPAHFEKLGIEVNQLRHIIEPYLQQTMGTSTVSDEKLEYFDSVDRLDDSNVITFGVENRIQTKRVVRGKMQRVDLVSMNTFLSYELYPDGRVQKNLFYPYEVESTKSHFGTLAQEFTVRPYEWLQLESRFDFDTRDSQFKVMTNDIIFESAKWRTVFGHRYIHKIPGFTDSNQFVFDGRYTLNKLWDVGGYIRWDMDRDDLQEWQLSATRDLHDFLFDFGYDVRNSGIQNSNKTLYFNLILKAEPGVHLQSGGSRASFGAPRIGPTMAGSGYQQTPTGQYGDRLKAEPY